MRLLLADAHPVRSLRIGAALVERHWKVDRADSAEEAFHLARRYDHDSVLVARGLPDAPDHGAVRRWRTKGLRTPVVALCGSDRTGERVLALSAGADDAVPDGIDPDELAARLLVVSRRGGCHARNLLPAGPMVRDLGAREVSAHGRPVPLTGKEFEVLEVLMVRKGTPFTRDAMLDHLYGGVGEPETKTLDVFVCHLRKKLADAGAGDLIGTAWGYGYVAREPGRGPRSQSSRKLDEAKRRRIAESVIVEGESVEAAALLHGVARSCAARIVARYRADPRNAFRRSVSDGVDADGASTSCRPSATSLIAERSVPKGISRGIAVGDGETPSRPCEGRSSPEGVEKGSPPRPVSEASGDQGRPTVAVVGGRGRPREFDAAKRREIAESVLGGGMSQTEAASLHGVSQPTVSRCVAGYKTRPLHAAGCAKGGVDSAGEPPSS